MHSHIIFARRNGTQVPKQNSDRRVEIYVWHPGAVIKGAPAVTVLGLCKNSYVEILRVSPVLTHSELVGSSDFIPSAIYASLFLSAQGYKM